MPSRRSEGKGYALLLIMTADALLETGGLTPD
jgi:hypothetical protein